MLKFLIPIKTDRGLVSPQLANLLLLFTLGLLLMGCGAAEDRRPEVSAASEAEHVNEWNTAPTEGGAASTVEKREAQQRPSQSPTSSDGQDNSDRRRVPIVDGPDIPEVSNSLTESLPSSEINSDKARNATGSTFGNSYSQLPRAPTSSYSTRPNFPKKYQASPPSVSKNRLPGSDLAHENEQGFASNAKLTNEFRSESAGDNYGETAATLEESHALEMAEDALPSLATDPLPAGEADEDLALGGAEPPRSGTQPPLPRQPADSHSELDEIAESVNVFFATDRRPTAEIMPSMFRTFAPALAVASICWAMLIGLALARRFQIMWMAGAGLATCLGIAVLHVCIVRWQEYSRIAQGDSTRFSVLRYEPEKDGYPLHVGVAQVTIPLIHQKGQVESPQLIKLEFSEDPEKHVMLQRVEVEPDVSEWFADLSESVRYEAKREAFIFIHGFNVKFGDALKRTAQLSSDLDITGPIISYSWPSRGNVAAYSADEASVAWSGPNLERLLVDLTSKTEIRKVNILAHSMGNRALLDSMERIYLRMGGKPLPAGEKKRIGALVLAAPDVDAQLFNARYYEAITQVADHSAVYFTDDDLALGLSARLHSAPRLGLGQLPIATGIEAIHSGGQGLFSLGHSYYGSDPAVIDDIRRVLSNLPPSQSDWLKLSETTAGASYWELDRDRYAQLQRTQAKR